LFKEMVILLSGIRGENVGADTIVWKLNFRLFSTKYMHVGSSLHNNAIASLLCHYVIVKQQI